jgi:alanine-glyoxylate transaminase/serine-glyoxylate transaminase/serine-pyruvate transaminase
LVERRTYLQIPGPVNIPDSILRELSRPLINHRGAEFESLLHECREGLGRVFQTANDIIMFPSSGSGGLESAVVNTISPGDKVFVPVQGVFSERFAKIAAAYGAEVEMINVDWGRAVDPDAVLERLRRDSSGTIKAVLIDHNETSTCVLNDVRSVGLGMREMGHPALLIVDAVSSMAMADLNTDEWRVDVAITGSQKGLMLPPGMAILSISPRAWEAYSRSKAPRWYWDWKQMKDAMDGGRVPYTPATTLMFGLRVALRMILDEGLENVFRRHTDLACLFRQGVRRIGLEVLPPEEEASPTVTAVKLPQGVSHKELSDLLERDYGVVIGEGLGKIKDSVFRVGHMGSIQRTDVLAVLSALEGALGSLRK